MNIKIEKIEANHIYNVIMNLCDTLKPLFDYSIDNLKIYSCHAQPHFLIWTSACHLANLGGEAFKDNVMEEMFGTSQFKEGNHSLLCKKHFAQLGQYSIDDYTSCSDTLDYVNSHLSLDKIKILYSFLIVIEVGSFFVKEMELVMKQLECIKDNTYLYVHEHADNREDGHGITMLKHLSNDNISVEEFNKGIDLFILFFSDIFKKRN